MKLFALVCMDAECREADGLMFVEAPSLDDALAIGGPARAMAGVEVPDPTSVSLDQLEQVKFVYELPRDVVIPADMMLAHWNLLKRFAA